MPWGWHASNAAWLVLAVTLAYVAGTWIGTLPPVIRLLTSPTRMRHKVVLRAERAFAQHAVSQTRERTGVLIMLSILERQIYVLPDRSLAGLVSAERWKQVVQVAVERLQRENPKMLKKQIEGWIETKFDVPPRTLQRWRKEPSS